MTSRKSVVVEHARSDEQEEVLTQIVTDNVCPFCLKNLHRYHRNPVVLQTDNWIVTENQWPYQNSEKQILIICRRHVESISDLTKYEMNGWFTVVQQVCKHFEINSGAVCMRFGDPILSGASVRHLHAQVIVPQSGNIVRFKIGSNK